MAINTLNTIKDAITSFADGHGQLQGRVIFEADDHRSAYITEENTYPLLFIAPIDVAVNRAMNVHTLRVYVYERINDDRLDVWENANDTSLILRDIRLWWNDYGVDEINIVEDPIGQFGCDKELDNLVGYYADIRFEIPSHGRCQVPVNVTPNPTPSCADAIQVITDSDGNELYSNSIPSGATETQIIQDSAVTLKDTLGATISTTPILAEGSKDITAPNATYTVEYLNGTLIQSGTIPSDSSELIQVPNPIVCADTTIEVNGVIEGTVASGSTVDIQLSDSGGVVVPTSVTQVGNDFQVVLPDSGGACIEEYGQIFYTDFTGSITPTGLTNMITNTVQNNELQVNSGSTLFSQYLELTQPMGVGDWEVKTTVEIDLITGSTFGFGIGINSLNSLFQYEIINHFVQSSGQVRFVRAGNTQININTSVLSFLVGHILEFSIRKRKKMMYAEIKNLNNGTSVFLNYNYITSSVVEPITSNIGTMRFYSFANGYTIKTLTINNLAYVGGVMYIGDSVTSGYNTTNGNSYPELVNYNKWNYFGGAGDSTTQILLAINQLTTQNIPNVAIIMLGLNDSQLITASQYEINLGLIVDALQSVGTTVKIIAPTPRNSNSMATYATNAVNVAIAKGCAYINGYTILKDPFSTNINPIYSTDGIHPNEAGHLVLANSIIANF